jgi:hypothetical protein
MLHFSISSNRSHNFILVPIHIKANSYDGQNNTYFPYKALDSMARFKNTPISTMSVVKL